MHSGLPANITHRKTRLSLPGRQAKRGHLMASGSIAPSAVGHEAGNVPVKGPLMAGSRMSRFDFPIAVMAHSPRIG